MACESGDGFGSSREVVEAFSVGLETCHIEVESTLERLDRVQASEGTSWMGTFERSGGERRGLSFMVMVSGPGASKREHEVVGDGFMKFL